MSKNKYEQATHLIEGELTAPDAEGKEWEVTIIGATEANPVITIEGREYIKSKNGRLYSVAALAESAGKWEGVKVYDNHLTQKQFEDKQGMRSPNTEWLGTIVKPYWDAAARKLKGVFKVVETGLRKKLLNAFEMGVLGTVGLSIDTFPIIGKPAMLEGRPHPIIEGFRKILSVDLVGDPAAGGGFDRLIAAHTEQENNMAENIVTREDLDALKNELLGSVKDVISDALAGKQPPTDPIVEEEVPEGEPSDELAKVTVEAQKAKTALMVERKLNAAHLTKALRTIAEDAFAGKIVTEAEVDKLIGRLKEAQVSTDPSGQPLGLGGQRGLEIGLSGEDKFAIEVQAIIMGREEFRKLESVEDGHVQERMRESQHYQDWVKKGKPNTGNYRRLSTVVSEFMGGDVFLNPHLLEAATTTTLATVVKNTVNIMTAADYNVLERWYEPIVTIREVDSIDDTTLARLHGTGALSTVSEGAAYTEITLQDEEEAPNFVKKGNFIGITWETMMRDKLNFIRTIPRKLALSWNNTLSDLVANVFTLNSNAGPVLSDTGALFNATALTTAGGHNNLNTTALSHAQYGTNRLEMMAQTDRALGLGRKLLIQPRFLLVPIDLETTARGIQRSELVPEADGAGTTGNQTTNIYRDTFETIVVPPWTDTNNYAMVGDPAQFPAIYLIFPRGNRTPQVFTAGNETGGAMFTNDEMRFKVRLATYHFSNTYDCAPVADWRPLHKSNVA